MDTGSSENGLVVSGTATGLDPTQMYFTLVYDKDSLPGGPNACTPPPTNDVTEDQMKVDFWHVHSDGTGTLFRVKTGSAYVALSGIATVSIRHVVGPPPEGFVLQACGEIHRNP